MNPINSVQLSFLERVFNNVLKMPCIIVYYESIFHCIYLQHYNHAMENFNLHNSDTRLMESAQFSFLLDTNDKITFLKNRLLLEDVLPTLQPYGYTAELATPEQMVEMWGRNHIR